ncbi:substrate-binding domain-containing protein [Actinacidiphila glaucinigra]|uniref:Xylose-binding protein n=1 Tax=Actinacidiphila glaucinigra TaxID=235986 RepID=A0A239D8X8_9ACTN|nr:sugar-binding protein [Actinacidiphila glaucinigra]SNS28304.1 xylose-binding protein [Actinacidiphila glaucinigra]
MHAGGAARLRTVTLAVLTLSLTAAATGCGNDSGGQSGEVKVGIALPTTKQTRWVSDGDNMKALFKKQGYKADVQYAEDSVDEQIKQVEKMIDSGDKLLIIGAVDGFELGDALQKASRAGVKVIAYDRLLLGSSNVDYYASFNNYKVGELQAQYIIDKLGLKKGGNAGPYNIELFAGDANDNNVRGFFAGAMDTLSDFIADGQLQVPSDQKRLSQVTTYKWQAEIANETMTTRLGDFYKSSTVDAVLAPNDGIARGIIDALKKDHYGTAGKPMPIVTGQDAEIDSVNEIIAGDQSMTVYKDTRKLAEVAVKMAQDILSGKRPETNSDNNDSNDNGNKVVPAYLLAPVSVDKSNYKKLLVDSGYIKASDLN